MCDIWQHGESGGRPNPAAGNTVFACGGGTTGAVFRAGIPHIIIPHGMEQLFWGRQIEHYAANFKSGL